MRYLKDIMQGRIEGWDKRFLSKGGKEFLLKTVAQSIPSHAMSVFMLPLEVCKDFERIMCKLWWKTGQSKNRGIHWMSWKRLSKSKFQGRISFRNIHDFNVAMVGKQGRRLLVNLWVSKIYVARYYPRGSFLTAILGCNLSYI